MAGADFPNAWPTPESATHRLALGGRVPSRLALPVAPAELAGAARPSFAPPPPSRALAEERPVAPLWEVREDVLADAVTVRIDYARDFRLPDGTAISETRWMESRVGRRDPAHAVARGETRVRRVAGGIATECVALGVLTGSARALHLVLDLDVRVDDHPHFQRRWSASVPRLLL